MTERKLILVVDDQAGIRALLLEALRGLYQVEAAASGLAAISFLKQTTPDLLLLDMNMPGMSGLETLRELRRFRPALPVLMITADRADGALSRALEQGISGWICKPFDLEELYRQVQAAIH